MEELIKCETWNLETGKVKRVTVSLDKIVKILEKKTNGKKG
jgi:hypothetical protein